MCVCVFYCVVCCACVLKIKPGPCTYQEYPLLLRYTPSYLLSFLLSLEPIIVCFHSFLDECNLTFHQCILDKVIISIQLHYQQLALVTVRLFLESLFRNIGKINRRTINHAWARMTTVEKDMSLWLRKQKRWSMWSSHLLFLPIPHNKVPKHVANTRKTELLEIKYQCAFPSKGWG